MGELRDRKDASPGATSDLLLTDALKKAQAVFVQRSLMALLAKLADRTMVFEDEPRRRVRHSEALDLVEQTPGGAGADIELDLTDPEGSAPQYDPVRGLLALNVAYDYAEDGQVKCAPEFGHENGRAYGSCTHALAECFSRH